MYKNKSLIGTYCPVSPSGKIFPSVRAVGRDGLWRLRQFDYRASKHVVAKALEDEACVLQAEEGFFLVELEVGNFMTIYLYNYGYIITVNVLRVV